MLWWCEDNEQSGKSGAILAIESVVSFLSDEQTLNIEVIPNQSQKRKAAAELGERPKKNSRRRK
jgi:hypothetical protein